MVQPRLQTIPVELIRLDADTQSRERVTLELVEEYANGWLHGTSFRHWTYFKAEMVISIWPMDFIAFSPQ